MTRLGLIWPKSLRVGPALDRRSHLHPALSSYFDLVRVSAAIAVLMSHCGPMLFKTPIWLFPGHDAVIVFFVLSGYVIAYSADGYDGKFDMYAVSRLSRLWSVSIPALITGLIVAILAGIEPLRPAVIAAAFDSVFMGESWPTDKFAPADGPMWSLNYEAWYYAIFAAWLFISHRSRWAWLALLCFIAGPKIAVLLPIWVTGVVLYRTRPTVSIGVAVTLLLFSIAGYAFAYHVQLQIVAQDWLLRVSRGESYRLGPSTSFPSDYAILVLVLANFVAVDNLTRRLHVPQRVRSAISFIASFTLTIYLFHMPITILLRDVFGLNGRAVMGLLFPVLILIGLVTEHQRQHCRQVLAALASKLGSIKESVGQRVRRARIPVVR